MTSVSDPSELGFRPDGLDRLRSVLRDEVDRKRIPGAVALIARHGRIAFLEAFGVQDPALPEVMRVDTIFRTASFSKPIVSLAVMMLVEDGRLSLEDPLATFVPAFAAPKVAVERDGGVELVPAEQPITIYDLLRHTSGLTYEFSGTAAVHRMYEEARFEHGGPTTAQVVERIAALPLLAQPGREFNYSRSTDVLGRVVELVSGRTLGAFLHERIFAPLGMDDTGFSVPAEKHDRIAEPFAADPVTGERIRVRRIREPVAFESGGGGIVSTATDYARFLEMLIAGGMVRGERLVGRKTLDLMRSDHLGPSITMTPDDAIQPADGFGLGFAIRLHPGRSTLPGSPGTYFWFGVNGQSFWVDPAEELYAIMLVQASPAQRTRCWALFRTQVYAALG
jgi:CubicO group peptidase (beta-lactamase class C family)